MPQTAKILNNFTESVIREMTRVSNGFGAVNLSQGFPDFDPPAELVAAAKKVLDLDHHQYAVTWGAPEFRRALAEKQSRWMNLDLDPDAHLVVTCGSTEAMITAMMTVCDPGDKVIVFSPFYENYAADALLSGAVPIHVPLRPPDFAFDPDELRRAFEQGVKALVLCNPSNPSGKVFTREELEYIASLACEFDAFVLTDEVYEHIVYEPHQHVYLASLPGMFERTLSCSSLSKTYAITGWRLGYVIASAEVISGARKVHDFLTVGAPHPLQAAAVTGLRMPDEYYESLRREYTERRDVFLGFLDLLGLKYTRPQGAYYVLVDFSDFGVDDDNLFARWLAEEIKVAGVPGSSFFSEPVHHLVRFHFAKNIETLKQAGQNLLRLGKAEPAWRAYKKAAG